MFPKHKHIEAFDSMGYNPQWKLDFTYLFKWLNDDLRVHWGLEEVMDERKWHFWVDRESNPFQTNGWDCGLYAIHFGFCFGLQTSFSGITPERIALYRKRLILYMLDGLPQRNILLSKPTWYEDFLGESTKFPNECRRLYGYGIPGTLVDVEGDGNCLYYCLLQYLVFQQQKFTDKWEYKAQPVMWIRRKIRKWVGELPKKDWLDATMCDDDTVIK